MAISEIDTKLSDQISAIMHNQKFQQMESAWRSLKFLVDRTNFRRNIKLDLLQVSKQELMDDFEDAPEPVQCGLYKQIYSMEYDQPGGEPYGAMITNYEFGRGPQDVGLLQNAAKVAAATHCPFISSAGSEFFGMKSILELPNVPDLASLFEQAEYTKWNAFRDSEDSRYVGLTVPRFLLRLPYGQDTTPVKEFDFEEHVSGEQHDKYLWGNASFAFASRLTESFSKWGWCVNIRGPQAGGLVEDLPLHLFKSGGDTETKIPTEILIPDRREFEFAQQGFIPLSFYKNKNYACFFSAQSVQRPKTYSTADCHGQFQAQRQSALSVPVRQAGPLPEGDPAREHRGGQGKRGPAGGAGHLDQKADHRDAQPGTGAEGPLPPARGQDRRGGRSLQSGLLPCDHEGEAPLPG